MRKKFIQPPFIQIPTMLITNPDLTRFDSILFGYIWELTRLKDKRCFASNELLAELCHAKPKTVQKSLANLERHGYIRRSFFDQSRRKRAEIIPLCDAKGLSLNGDSVSLKRDSEYLQNEDDVPLNGDQSNNNIKIKENNNNIISAPANAGPEPPILEAVSAFDQFWEVYPKKELKKKTEEMWHRNKLNNRLPEILAFIEKAKHTDRWQKGFIKQPPAFLNGECWNDDLSAYGGIKTIKAKSLEITNKYDVYDNN